MKQIPEYSLVVFPNPEQSSLVKSYKELLRKHIGWFGSANATAHITIINFDDDFSLNLHLEQIRDFCNKTKPQDVILNHFDSFGDRTFFIAPNSESKLYLDQLISDLHKFIGYKTEKTHSHLSIARGLNADTMKKACELFQNTKVYLEFNCNAIHIRKFNHQTKQYSDIIERIDFKG